jgi:hypothetical protein
MTDSEHAAQLAAVRASLQLAPTTAEKHGGRVGPLLSFGLFIGAVIYLVNRETMHTLDETDRELAEQRMIRRLARQERRRMDGGWRG